MAEFKWYKIKKGTDIFTLGRLPYTKNKEEVIKKLIMLFEKDEPVVEFLKARGEPLFLIEEGNKKEIPLQIIGEGTERVAKIGS